MPDRQAVLCAVCNLCANRRVHTKVLAPQGFTFCVHECIQGKGEEKYPAGWPPGYPYRSQPGTAFAGLGSEPSGCLDIGS
jgi:hypothetical protein